MPSDNDFQTRLLIELQRIAGALECLCEHLGAYAPRNNSSSKARKGGGK